LFSPQAAPLIARAFGDLGYASEFMECLLPGLDSGHARGQISFDKTVEVRLKLCVHFRFQRAATKESP
jgi:hypothetical protein